MMRRGLMTAHLHPSAQSRERMPDMGKRCTMGFQPFQNEQGAILVIALILTCILAISGTMAYQMTANELLIAGNFNNSRGALNAASAGIEEARARIRLPSYDTFAISNPNPGSSDEWTPYPNSIQPDSPDYHIEIQHKTNDDGDLSYYGYESTSDLTISAFSTSDPTEYHPIDIIISTMSSTGTYKNNRTEIRAEVARNPGPPILAALYAENDVDGDASSDDATLDLLDIQRNDNCSAGAITPVCSFCGAAPDKSYDIYLYSSDTTITPSIVTSNPSLAPDLSDMSDGISDINIGSVNINIIQGIASLKTFEEEESDCFNSYYNICSFGDDPTISDGTGVLMVEGNLTLEGITWSGLILVTGELTLNGGVVGETRIEGAVLVNGKVWINDTNPGPVIIIYNSCAIDAALSSIPLRVLSWEDTSITPDP